MGYSVWDSMWGFGHHHGKKKEEEAADVDHIECKCRVVGAEEDDRKERNKHGCGCPKCRHRHGKHEYHCKPVKA
ncbi:hypothetical protein DT065_05545 [Salicibibacter kimchii]|uniref:Uncharacterized protein n=1 Tax=Salicibibacter kimchii TaxID=2099786 RepID=A0A345BX55_9BACI|nr:hypothetical protein DT065_05545 [Salicibibacter kimchii]